MSFARLVFISDPLVFVLVRLETSAEIMNVMNQFKYLLKLWVLLLRVAIAIRRSFRRGVGGKKDEEKVMRYEFNCFGLPGRDVELLECQTHALVNDFHEKSSWIVILAADWLFSMAAQVPVKWSDHAPSWLMHDVAVVGMFGGSSDRWDLVSPLKQEMKALAADWPYGLWYHRCASRVLSLIEVNQRMRKRLTNGPGGFSSFRAPPHFLISN